MNAPLNPDLIKKLGIPVPAVEGKLTEYLNNRVINIANSFIPDAGSSIKVESVGEFREPYSFESHLETTMVWASGWVTGYKTWSGAKKFGSKADAAKEAQYRAVQMSDPILIQEIAQKLLGSTDQVVQFFRNANQEIELPTRSVVSYSHRGCAACRTAGQIPCETCGTKGKIQCRNYSCRWGKVSCTWCGGKGVVLGATSHQWIDCSACYKGQANCSYCDGNAWISCDSCGGHCYFRCNPCDGEGGFTDYFETFGKTKANSTLSLTSEIKHQSERWWQWARAGFPGVGASSDSPTLKRKVGSIIPTNEGGYRYSLIFKGSALTAYLFGKYGGDNMMGTAVWLDEARSRFSSFLDKPLAAFILNVFDGATDIRELDSRIEESPVLKQIAKSVRSTSKINTDELAAHADQSCEALKIELLETFADGYSEAKNRVAGQIWQQTWRKYAFIGLLFPLLFLFFNVPYMLHSSVGSQFGRDVTLGLALFMFLASIGAPVVFAVRRLDRELRKKLGPTVAFPDKYPKHWFVLAGLAIGIVAASGATSTAIQGPNFDGLYFSKASLWAKTEGPRR